MTDLTRRAFGKLAFAATGATLVAGTAKADGHAANHVVTIKGFKFAPAKITIKAGDSVTFVNTDDAPHTATADNGSFDTGRLGKGVKSKLKFETAGTYSYFCAVHPMMKGSITVEG